MPADNDGIASPPSGSSMIRTNRFLVSGAKRMTRQVRNVDHIRMLLRQMDRSVDDARSRREGVPSDATAAPPPTAPSPIGAPATAPTATHIHGAQASSTPTSLSGGPTGQRPLAKPSPSNPTFHSGGNGMHGNHPAGNGVGNGAGGPPRIKAKPKRSSPDPLQDFQQRQAS